MASPTSPTTRPKHLASLLRLLDAPWIDQTRLDSLFSMRRQSDQLGTTVYAVCACLFLIAVSGPTSVAEFAGIPLWICFLAHLRRNRRLWTLAFIDPRFLLLLALAAWMALSLLWSPDPAQGFEELGALRWSWILIVLYPVLDQRRLLIAAYALGLLAGNATQLVHALQSTVNLEIFSRAPGRISGWWDPVVGGSILCAALGLHLAPAMMGTGRTRLLAIAAALASFAGIIATGSRGAWIAAAILIAITTLVAILRVHPRKRALVPAAAIASLLIIALSATAWTMRDSPLASRITTGYQEVRSALSNGQYNSDTGARIYMNMRAAQAFASHPVQGVGAGGYRTWVNDYDPQHADIAHDHAHSAPLHAAATLGLVGLTLNTLLLIAVFRGALHACNQQPSEEDPQTPLGTYSAGPIFALTGLLLVGFFDTVQINAATAAQLAILITLCPPVLPRQFSSKSQP
jgi:O-antigen ligase